MIGLRRLFGGGPAVEADKGIPMDCDPLKAYHKEIAPYPILSWEEEFKVTETCPEHVYKKCVSKLEHRSLNCSYSRI
jgi:hypothetical protein